jgi:hypothetical protein
MNTKVWQQGMTWLGTTGDLKPKPDLQRRTTPRHRIVADRREAFKAHVASADGPLIILFQHQRADHSNDGTIIGKNADDIRAAFDFAVEAFERIGAGDLRPVLLGEGGISQDILSRFIYQFGKFRCRLTQRIGDASPLRMGVLRGLLGEDGLDHGDDCGALLGSDVGRRVAHPVDATPLQGGAENLRGGRTQALVIVGDDQLDTAQATLGRAGGDT